MAEILIFGKRSGAAAADHSDKIKAQLRDRKQIHLAHEKINGYIKPGSEVARPLQRSLRDLMWTTCGVVRTEKKMIDGLHQIEELKERSRKLDVRPDSEGYEDLMLAFDFEASIISAEATLLSANKREESRGAHQRSDFPKLSKSDLVNYRVSLDTDERLNLKKNKIKALNSDLKNIVNNTSEIGDFTGRLIE